MSLIFDNSIPHGMKKKKLYDEDSKFTDDDLQDVLDGLLKLGVSNTTKQSPHTTHTGTHHSKSSPSSPSKYKSSTSTSPNQHHLSHQQQQSSPTNTAKKKNQTATNPFSAFNLLFEAAKKVEGKENFFKIDVADIERVTDSNTNTSCNKNTELNTSFYDKETGILRIKSKNAICAPGINANDSLFDLPTFEDLNDDFSPFDRRLSGISSIGRRSSFLSSSLNASYLSSLQSIEDQREQRKQNREWSLRNIKEMDQMYLNKSKLAQKLKSESPQSQQKSIQSVSKSKLGADEICKEFSESNSVVKSAINTYQANVDQIKQQHSVNEKERERQNAILMQQLQIMQDKITRQQQQERDMKRRREEEASKQRQQIEQQQEQKQQKQKEIAAQRENEQKQKQKEDELQKQKAAQIAEQQQKKEEAVKQQQKRKEILSKQEWYPHQKELSAKCNHYKAMYKQFESLVSKFESSDFEMNIGLILRSISSNQKSVFDAFKRFQTLINEQTQQNSAERSYCFIQITNLIIEDVRIVKSSAQKFASSYFLSFIMNEFEKEYLEILKCCFYNNCIWTLPHIDNQLNVISQDSGKPSIIRCVLLKYMNIKRIDNVPSEKRKYLQSFAKSSKNAGNVVFESEDKYFTRTQHICGLFAAFMSIRNGDSFKNPFGVDAGDCWQWIAHLLSLPECVYPELCAILSIVLQVVGHEMLEKYPRQFPKIIQFIHGNIWQKTDSSTTTRAKAQRELNLILRQCQDSMKQNNGKIKIKKPKESELIKETVGASALTNIEERPPSSGRGGYRGGRGGRGRGRGRGGYERRWR